MPVASFRSLLSHHQGAPHPRAARRRRRVDVECITVAYYATLLLIGGGLTGVLGYEIGWLAAHNQPSLVTAAVLVPWVVFLAWTVSEER
jgi:hypothetical protein